MEIELHPKQWEAFESTATEILYGGAAGGGKSFLLRVKALEYCFNIPNVQVYLFRRNYDELIANHFNGPTGFPELLQDYTTGGVCRITWGKPPSIRFVNGSQIHLCHCQYEKDLTHYQGHEIHVLIMDELTHFTASIYKYLRARCRAAGLKVPEGLKLKLPLIMNATNPGGIGHNWVKTTFIDMAKPMEIRQMPREEGGMLRQYIPAKLHDNPSLDAEDYSARLAGLGSPHLVKALLDGDWNIVAGGMFDDLWNPDIHVIPPFEIPKEWRVDRSFDWGSSKPYSVGWWAQSDGSDIIRKDGTRLSTLPGDLFRIAELYGWKGTPNEGTRETSKEIAEKIKDRERTLGHEVKPGPADNSIFDVVDGRSIAGEMASVGVKWRECNKGPGSRKNGWEIMRQMLKSAKERDDKGLFIFDTCRQFIRTIPVLPRDVDGNKSDDIDTQAEDHIADETRYRILASSRRAKSSDAHGLTY